MLTDIHCIQTMEAYGAQCKVLIRLNITLIPSSKSFQI